MVVLCLPVTDGGMLGWTLLILGSFLAGFSARTVFHLYRRPSLNQNTASEE